MSDPALHTAPKRVAPEAQHTLAVLRANRADLRSAYAVRSLALFGSAVRGDARPGSDADLLVEFDRPIGLLHLTRTARHLEEILGAPVDLVLKRAILPELREGILNDAVDVF